MSTSVCVCAFFFLTHWVEQHSKKQLSPADALVQFFGSAGIFLIINGVSKQATRLTRQHLHICTRAEREEGIHVNICILVFGWTQEVAARNAARGCSRKTNNRLFVFFMAIYFCSPSTSDPPLSLYELMRSERKSVS